MLTAGIITPNLGIGGAEHWVANLVRYMDPAKVKWTGLVVSGWGAVDPAMCRIITGAGVPIYSEPPILKTAKHKRPTPHAQSPDCSEYITYKDNMPGALEAACGGSDVLLAWGSVKYATCLTFPEAPSHFVYCSHSSHHPRTKVPVSDNYEVHLTAVSEAAKKPVDAPGNPPITVIHNGVPEERLIPQRGYQHMRDQWGVGPQHKVIGYIGRQSAEKNPIAALSAVRALGDDWLAVYYGSPLNMSPKSQKAFDEARANPDSNVRFYDSVGDVGSIYNGIDVLMLASHTEAFSLTMIEAWLSKTPVVSTLVGALPELQAIHGELAITVSKDPTPEVLAAACRRAVSREGREIADRAYIIAKEHFTVDKMVNRWSDYLTYVVRPDTFILDL